MEEFNVPVIYHKIMANKPYTIKKQTFSGYTFYKIAVSQKTFDGQTKIYDYPVNFKNGVELDDGETIIITKGYENIRDNKNDKYSFITSIMIEEFEKVEKKQQETKTAIDEYNQKMNTNDITFTDDDFDF